MERENEIERKEIRVSYNNTCMSLELHVIRIRSHWYPGRVWNLKVVRLSVPASGAFLGTDLLVINPFPELGTLLAVASGLVESDTLSMDRACAV